MKVEHTLEKKLRAIKIQHQWSGSRLELGLLLLFAFATFCAIFLENTGI